MTSKSANITCPLGKSFFSLFFCLLVFPHLAFATPPLYKTFKREQRIHHAADTQQIMRIWGIYVGQGDAFLVEFPAAYKPNIDPHGNANDGVQLLIDGGSVPPSESKQLIRFLKTRFPNGVSIDYAVLTHHDQDHVDGLIRVLGNNEIGIANIIHNGLASYHPSKHPNLTTLDEEKVVLNKRSGRIVRIMGEYDSDENFLPEYVINDRADASEAFQRHELQGIYKRLVSRTLNKSNPHQVFTFNRAHIGSNVFDNLTANVNHSPIQLTPFWPIHKLKRYDDWSHSVNGNSVSFQLKFGDFQMMFTGDHNVPSEQHLLETLRETDQLSLLNCDVFKVPHHGSDHAHEEFIRTISNHAVLSVASMGNKGFGKSWKHPSSRLVTWLGGAHRVYHTHVHEKRFRWEDLNTKSDMDRLVEQTHVLIETDGEWFRVVEVEPNKEEIVIPPVQSVRRGDGTRWIRAK